jgi:hypothetical protein
MRNNRRSKLEHDCPNRACLGYSQSKLDDDTQAVKSLTTASNVLLFGGGALLAGGVVLIVVGRGSVEKAPSQNTALLAGAPGADAGLTLRGRW